MSHSYSRRCVSGLGIFSFHPTSDHLGASCELTGPFLEKNSHLIPIQNSAAQSSLALFGTMVLVNIINHQRCYSKGNKTEYSFEDEKISHILLYNQISKHLLNFGHFSSFSHSFHERPVGFTCMQ